MCCAVLNIIDFFFFFFCCAVLRRYIADAFFFCIIMPVIWFDCIVDLDVYCFNPPYPAYYWSLASIAICALSDQYYHLPSASIAV